MPLVFLDRSVTDMNTQLEQFATNTFRLPQSIVPCHLLDQRHGLSGYLRFGRSRPRFVLPEKSRIPGDATAAASSSWTMSRARFQV
jgi:hypothetical protein